ncbi:hypothetical protein Tco_0461710 [Tanacetum coccineum]
MAVRGQNQGNRKNKHAYAPKPKIPPPPKREDPTKESICHECGPTTFVIQPKGLRASRKLKSGDLHLYMGNGQREAVEAIGNFDLSLPSGLVIVLNNCHYAPSITRGVISVFRLYEDDELSNEDIEESSCIAVGIYRALEAMKQIHNLHEKIFHVYSNWRLFTTKPPSMAHMRVTTSSSSTNPFVPVPRDCCKLGAKASEFSGVAFVQQHDRKRTLSQASCKTLPNKSVSILFIITVPTVALLNLFG